ncbi:MAG: peptidylprolyl isomerase [Elusimicrobia bacterium]|nr:peptidylprolyl isomerase [Elusimicrobiota bacterium]
MIVPLLLAGLVFAQGVPADERVVFHTPHGDIVAALYPAAAPRHVAQMLRLARLGAYDATPVAHVLRGYLIQFAGVRNRRRRLSAAQEAGLRRLPLEANGMPHRRGTLSMSRKQDDEDSAESSFSILLKDAPHLDGRYTAFGQVESGWEALDALSALPTTKSDEPLHWTELTRVDAVPAAEVDAKRWTAAAGRRGPRGELIWLLLAVVLSSAAGALAEGRVPGRPLRAACLLNALLAFFAVLVSLSPSLPLRGWVPAVLFASALSLFRLLSAFEPPA